MNKTERKKKFIELFNLIKPEAKKKEKIVACAAFAMISESSVRVYISNTDNSPSARTLEILMKACKRRKLI